MHDGMIGLSSPHRMILCTKSNSTNNNWYDYEAQCLLNTIKCIIVPTAIDSIVINFCRINILDKRLFLMKITVIRTNENNIMPSYR